MDLPSLQLAEMARTSDLLSGDGDVATMLQTLALRALELVAGDLATIAIFASPGVTGRSAHAAADATPVQTLRPLPVVRPDLAELVNRNRPLRVESLKAIPYFDQWAQGEGAAEVDPFIGVSLRAGGAPIGWLSIGRQHGAEPFSEIDELMAGVLASQAAAALANSLARERISLEAARADALLRASDYGVLEIETGGTIREANHAAERLLGYDAKTLLGEDFHALLHHARNGPVHPSEECRVLEVLETGITYRGDDVFRRGDGKHIDVSLSTAAVAAAGETPYGIVVVFHDVTERMRREQMKDDFFAFAAHEVRSPLTTVTGFARWLHRRALTKGEHLDTDEKDAIESLAVESQRVATTIEVLLDLTRIQSERLLMDPEEVDLREAIRKEASRLAASNPEAQVSLNLPDQPLIGRLDPDRLRQIIENLLTNAVKYGGSPPSVAVEVAQSPSGVIVAVLDNGAGIAEADRPHVFERFYRSATNSVSSKKGLGVGLYIAHEIVERMGGSLRFESSPAGTRFILELPLAADSTADDEGALPKGAS